MYYIIREQTANKERCVVCNLALLESYQIFLSSIWDESRQKKRYGSGTKIMIYYNRIFYKWNMRNENGAAVIQERTI